MKTLLFVLAFSTSLHAPAQNQNAFYSADSSHIKQMANAIVENAVNKYQAEKTFAQRNTVEFWYRAVDKTLMRILFKFFPDRSAVLAHVDGKFEDVFPFWKKYFQPNADQAGLQAAYKAEEVSLPFSKRYGSFFISSVG